MSDVEGWEIPTLSFLKDEPLIFGVPKQQAAYVLLLGFVLFIFVTKFVGIVFGALATIAIPPAVLVILRFLYKRDPHWMSPRRYPLVRYIGN